MNNDNTAGWVNFYKPVGMRSMQAVTYVKQMYNARKAGHAGTLDPLADGVLPIALDDATKQMPSMVGAIKEYFFTIEFGKQTETDDAEGIVIAQSNQRPTLPEIKKTIEQHFIGDIQQIPPAYSAIRINGVRSYKKARMGQAVHLQSRSVTIYSLDVAQPDEIQQLNELRAALADNELTHLLYSNNISQTDPVPFITLKASVSKGTYVRSLARDLGLYLGCYGYVTVLTRTRVGNFVIEKCCKITQFFCQ